MSSKEEEVDGLGCCGQFVVDVSGFAVDADAVDPMVHSRANLCCTSISSRRQSMKSTVLSEMGISYL